MIREPLIMMGIGTSKGFRFRGGDVSRVEGFSDAVFGFALTLLVVSQQVPTTFDQLWETLRGFGAFAICFAILVNVWFQHYLFFRRYGLQDSLTITLNAVLLFVIVFFVYPLKFIFTLLINGIFRMGAEHMIRGNQIPILFVVYGAGFVVVNFVFALFYLHAMRQRKALELDEMEVMETREETGRYFALMAIGLLSIAIAVIGGPSKAAFAGFSYFLIGVVETVSGMRRGEKRRKLEEQLFLQKD